MPSATGGKGKASRTASPAKTSKTAPAKAKAAAKPAAVTKPAKPAKAAEKKAPVPAKAASATKAAKKAMPKIDPEQRLHYVQVAAYYIAERRGFLGGCEVEDWAQAEREIDDLLREGRLSV